jgi:hypothetical protein
MLVGNLTLLEEPNTMRKIYFATFMGLYLCVTAFGDVRIKQRVTMSGQKFESTRSIKGSRERTEQHIQMDNPAMADYMPQVATITQCDMKRTVRLNDRKQLYMVEPFQTASDATPVQRTTPASTQTTTRRGGTMTMTYIIKDTGERKTIFGLQARHLIITQEMETSVDSCNGPNKSRMEFDGWYVDFTAEFNCPNAQTAAPVSPGTNKPDCIDRVVYKGNAGAARLGFLLEGTMKMIGSDGAVQMTQTTETLELSRATLDASLFDVPASYKQVSSSQDLYAVGMPTAAMVDRETRSSSGNTGIVPPGRPAAKSVAVSISFAPGASGNQTEIDQYVRSELASRGLRVVSGAGDYTLNLQFRQVKESTAGKIGGMFGKVTGVDTKVGKVDIDMSATLSGGTTGEAKVKNKFDGPLADAVHSAVDQALAQLLRGIGN